MCAGARGGRSGARGSGLGRPARRPSRAVRPLTTRPPRRGVALEDHEPSGRPSGDSVPAPCLSPAKQPQSKYTADRNIPGAFEGETVTRRRFMTLTTHTAGGIATAAVLLPALGFAAGSAIFERAPGDLDAGRQARGLPGRRLPAARDHDHAGHRRGRQDHGLRAPPATRRSTRARASPRRRRPTRRSSRSPARCMHLGCPVRWTSAAAALHLPVPRRRLRLQGRGRPAARRCARSTTSTRGCATARSRSARATRSTRVRALPELPRSGPAARRHRPVPLPRALLDAEEPMRLPTLPKPPVPKRFQDKPAPPGARREGQAARAGQGSRHHAPRTGSTSAPRSPAACAGCSSARCRRGPTGSTRSARRRCSRSSRRRSPACSWRCTTRRRRPRPTSRRATSPTTSSSASSCAACTSGARR